MQVHEEKKENAYDSEDASNNQTLRTFDVITSTENVPISFELPKTPLDYTKLLFFKN